MIEKITPDHILGLDGLPTTIMPDSAKLMRKINELCDVVNEQQKQIDKMSCAILDLATPNGENKALKSIQVEPADPYAEQRKLIGKLCKFWNGENNKTVGVLMEVREIQNKVFFVDDIFCKYEYCEPVKPDDDIIYKGETK